MLAKLLEIMGWKNLDRQLSIKKATMVFKCQHGLARDYLATNYFKNSFIVAPRCRMAFLVRQSAQNPPGRSNAQSALLYTARYYRKQLFNGVIYSYSYRIVFGIGRLGGGTHW